MSVKWMRSGIIEYLYDQWNEDVDPHVCADYVFDNNYFTPDYGIDDHEAVYRSIYTSVRKQYRLLDKCEELLYGQAQGNIDIFAQIIEDQQCPFPRKLGRFFLEKRIN